jgi:hypothetical protein
VSLYLKRCLVCKAWKEFDSGRWRYMLNKSFVYRSRHEKAVKGELPIVKQRHPSIKFDSNDKYLNWNLKNQFTCWFLLLLSSEDLTDFFRLQFNSC